MTVPAGGTEDVKPFPGAAGGFFATTVVPFVSFSLETVFFSLETVFFSLETVFFSLETVFFSLFFVFSVSPFVRCLSWV